MTYTKIYVMLHKFAGAMLVFSALFQFKYIYCVPLEYKLHKFCYNNIVFSGKTYYYIHVT